MGKQFRGGDWQYYFKCVKLPCEDLLVKMKIYLYILFISLGIRENSDLNVYIWEISSVDGIQNHKIE